MYIKKIVGALVITDQNVDSFVAALDKLSIETIAAIKAKEPWVKDYLPEVQDAINKASDKLQNPKGLLQVDVDLAVQLFSRLEIERTMVLLKLFSEHNRTMIYQAINTEHLKNEELRIYQTVFIQRLLFMTRTPVAAAIFSHQKTTVISDYLSRAISFKIEGSTYPANDAAGKVESVEE